MYKVGDHVQFKSNPWDEQIPEELERYNELDNQVQSVIEVKDVSNLDGTSGQWIKTDCIEEWVDSSYFKEPVLSEVLR